MIYAVISVHFLSFFMKKYIACFSPTLGVLIIPVGLRDKQTLKRIVLLCVVCDLKMLIVCWLYSYPLPPAVLLLKWTVFYNQFDLFFIICHIVRYTAVRTLNRKRFCVNSFIIKNNWALCWSFIISEPEYGLLWIKGWSVFS